MLSLCCETCRYCFYTRWLRRGSGFRVTGVLVDGPRAVAFAGFGVQDLVANCQQSSTRCVEHEHTEHEELPDGDADDEDDVNIINIIIVSIFIHMIIRSSSSS